MRATCGTCGELIDIYVEGTRMVGTRCQCCPLTEIVDFSRTDGPALTKGVGGSTGEAKTHPAGPSVPKKPWSNARKTMCSYSHLHASGMEAHVCDRLTLECKVQGFQLRRQVRMPLLALPEPSGCVRTLCVDFAILGTDGRLLRLVDAKAKGRVSRDWPARKRACELSWGIPVEEVDA